MDTAALLEPLRRRLVDPATPAADLPLITAAITNLGHHAIVEQLLPVARDYVAVLQQREQLELEYSKRRRERVAKREAAEDEQLEELRGRVDALERSRDEMFSGGYHRDPEQLTAASSPSSSATPRPTSTDRTRSAPATEERLIMSATGKISAAPKT